MYHFDLKKLEQLRERVGDTETWGWTGWMADSDTRSPHLDIEVSPGRRFPAPTADNCVGPTALQAYPDIVVRPAHPVTHRSDCADGVQEPIQSYLDIEMSQMARVLGPRTPGHVAPVVDDPLPLRR